MRSNSARSIGQSTSDYCRPAHCALGAKPHRHCACGLAMPIGAKVCDDCRSEGFQPSPSKPTDQAEEWDGVSYPALRLNRPTDVPHEAYEALLRAILCPLPAGHPWRSTAEEAA